MTATLGQLDADAKRIATALVEGYSGDVDRCLMLATLIRAELMREKMRIPKKAPKLSVSKHG